MKSVSSVRELRLKESRPQLHRLEAVVYQMLVAQVEQLEEELVEELEELLLSRTCQKNFFHSQEYKRYDNIGCVILWETICYNLGFVTLLYIAFDTVLDCFDSIGFVVS